MKAVIKTQKWYPVFMLSDTAEDIKAQPQYIYEIDPDLLKRYKKCSKKFLGIIGEIGQVMIKAEQKKKKSTIIL